jgi:cytochrome c oxidase subunit 3
LINKFNSFHLVTVRPWPFFVSNLALCLTSSLVVLFNYKTKILFMISLSFMILLIYYWWRDIHRESRIQGSHTKIVINGLKIGIVLFIISEIFFFISFFWRMFHSCISPSIEIGQNWPPISITFFNPIRVPLLNTIILLSSGISITWSHHEILNNNFKNSKVSLVLTIFLGVVFTIFQLLEYLEAPFCISDSCFGSVFFLTTGFHGLHVIFGSLFIFVSFIRFNKLINSKNHIVGFELAAWYWHFVDVVWLFLYFTLYLLRR